MKRAIKIGAWPFPAVWLIFIAVASVAAPSDQEPPAQKAPGQRACVNLDRSQIRIPGGKFLMGSEKFYGEEGPVREVIVDSFWMDRFDVTNEQFAQFVAATGYVTDAERKPDARDYADIPPDKLIPGGAVFTPGSGEQPSQHMEWWQFVPNADWRHPYGPKSSIVGRDHDPVVQVSYNDAMAYAKWADRDLPTEEQYEYAARGGLDGKTYAWGNELTPGGRWMANVWQGRFPKQDSADDGYVHVAPVGCFPANGYGLYDMSGNVWKWTLTRYASKQSSLIPASRVERVLKGGSFMCSSNYCRRFRPSARQAQESGFSSVHIGFRTVTNRRIDHGPFSSSSKLSNLICWSAAAGDI